MYDGPACSPRYFRQDGTLESPHLPGIMKISSPQVEPLPSRMESLPVAAIFQCPICNEPESSTRSNFTNDDFDIKIKCFGCRKISASNRWLCQCIVKWHQCTLHRKAKLADDMRCRNYAETARQTPPGDCIHDGLTRPKRRSTLESIAADDIRQGTKRKSDGTCYDKMITLGEPIYRHWTPHFARARLKRRNVGPPPLPPNVSEA